MHIGTAYPCNIHSFRNHLDNESRLKLVNAPYLSTSVDTLLLELLKQGHSITIFTKHPVEKLLYLKGENLQIYVIPSCKTYPWKYLHGVWIDALTIKKEIAKHVHSLDVLHAHWTYDFAWAAGNFTAQLPVFCTIHDWAPYIFSTVSLKNKITWLFKLILNRIVFLNTKIRFIANSPYVAQSVEKAFKIKKTYKNIEFSDNEDDDNDTSVYVSCLYIHEFKKWKPYILKQGNPDFIKTILFKEKKNIAL